MGVMKLSNMIKRYGGQRHPRIHTYEYLHSRKELVEWRYVPKGSTVIYVSHEWAGDTHPDPEGSQIFHLLLIDVCIHVWTC